jgi:hypothetical protein
MKCQHIMGDDGSANGPLEMFTSATTWQSPICPLAQALHLCHTDVCLLLCYSTLCTIPWAMDSLQLGWTAVTTMLSVQRNLITTVGTSTKDHVIFCVSLCSTPSRAIQTQITHVFSITRHQKDLFVTTIQLFSFLLA